MRTRLVKPGFFTSETLGELPALTRLLFIGLWCVADKEGRLLDRPKQIKAQILPYDDCDVGAALDALVAAGHVKRYEAESLQIIEVINFTKHQTLTSWEKKDTEALPQDFRSTSKGKPKRVRSTSDYIDVNKNTNVNANKNENVDTGSSSPEREDESPTVLTFPLAGDFKAPPTWNLHQSMVDEFRELYPAVDVPQECRNALGWCKANETRRKTSAGMPKFLNAWMAKRQNDPQGPGYTPSRNGVQQERNAIGKANIAAMIAERNKGNEPER